MTGISKRRTRQRGLSRIEAVAAVVTLVVVVASLFMLKGKFVVDEPDAGPGVEQSAGSTPQPSAASTAVSNESTPEPPKSGELHFAAGSTGLPVAAEDTIAPLVTALRGDGLLTAVLIADPTGSTVEVARARAGTVRHAFEADGISAARVAIEVGPVRGSTASNGGSGASRPGKSPAAGSGTVRIELRTR